MGGPKSARRAGEGGMLLCHLAAGRSVLQALKVLGATTMEDRRSFAPRTLFGEMMKLSYGAQDVKKEVGREKWCSMGQAQACSSYVSVIKSS